MRRLKILKVNPVTSGVPGSIEVGTEIGADVDADYTNIFNGRFYRNTAGTTQPAYTDPAPVDYTLISATTFDIVDNEKYLGRYTVYTPEDVGDLDLESWFTVNKTTVNVNEAIPPLDVGDPLTLESDGYVTNISTYLLYTGTAELVIPPGVNITSYPIEFMGRGTSGWGEMYAQNYINIARNFANGVEPVNPFVGQTWYDTDDHQMRSFNGSSWTLVNQAAFGVTFRHTQGAASTSWTVNHLLGLPAPYTAFVQFFVDRGSGPQLIIPAEVTFNTANQLTVTFSNPEIGYVLVHP